MFSLLLCHCSLLTDTAIIITTTACLKQLFATLFTIAIVRTSHETCHKTAWITTDLLIALSCLFICAYLQPTKCSQIGRFTISLSRDIYRGRLYICILIHVFPKDCCCLFRSTMYLLMWIWVHILLQSTPTLLQSTPTLLHSTPTLLQSTPTLLQSTPTLLQSTPIRSLSCMWITMKVKCVNVIKSAWPST